MTRLLLVLLASSLGACSALTPVCGPEVLSCSRGADGTWRCPPGGSVLCADGEVRESCQDHGAEVCVVRY